MASSSDSDDSDRKLPASYRSRRRRNDQSSSSSKTYSDSSEDERRRQRRRRSEQKKRSHRKRTKKDRPMWREEGELSDDRESSSDSSSSRSRSRSRQRNRKIEKREKERPFVCKECGCKYLTLKGLIHHEMNDHNLDAECHICSKKFEDKKSFREHYEQQHTNDVVKCIFCKSSFDQGLEMSQRRWDDFFSHIYGEILYSRIATYEGPEGKSNCNTP